MLARALLLVSLCTTSSSWATPSDDARTAYQAATTAYANGRYGDAAERFKEAYSLDPDPGYLFNIAQAYRLGQLCANAVDYYDRFLAAVPDPPERDAVVRYR